jgi:hypothetical protein
MIVALHIHKWRPWLVDFSIPDNTSLLYPKFRYADDVWYWGDKEYITKVAIRRAWEEPDGGVIGVFDTENLGELFQMSLAIRSMGLYQAEKTIREEQEKKKGECQCHCCEK